MESSLRAERLGREDKRLQEPVLGNMEIWDVNTEKGH